METCCLGSEAIQIFRTLKVHNGKSESLHSLAWNKDLNTVVPLFRGKHKIICHLALLLGHS